MAEKKKTTQAGKNSSVKKNQKSASKSKTNLKNKKAPVEESIKIPGRVIAAIVCAVVFILFLTMFLQPGEGILITPLRPIMWRSPA